VTDITDAQVQSHDLTVYRNAHNRARALLTTEIDKQQLIAEKSADDDEATAAAAAALALTSKLAVFEAEHDRFLVTVFIQTINIGPSKAVVDETQALATALAAAVKKKNAPALALKALTKYLAGAIAVFNGKVPVPPAAALAPAQE
jgi:type IV secretory pathway VirJ component